MGKEKDYGEPINYDPTFNGPTHNRSCTDIVWLILFILFLGLWGYVAYYSMTHGNVQQLLAPMDSGGLHCGFDSGVADKKYLVFFDLTKCLSAATPIVGCATHQVCVKKCPTTTHLFNVEMNAANFEQHKQHLVCMYDIMVDSLDYTTANRYIDEGKCAKYVLKSQSVLERCLPDTSELVDKMHEIAVNLTGLTETQIASQVADLVRFNQLSSQIVSDLVQSRWYLAGALAGVVVLCFLYILLLRWVVGPLVWLSIAGLLALLAFATYLCYNNYVYYRAHPVTPMATTNVLGKLRSLLTMKETWMGLVILVAVVLVVLLLIVIFLRARITIAIALIREGSRAVTAIKSTVLFPIFPWILQCVVIAFGVVVFMYILSIGDRMFKVINLKNDSLCICNPQSAYSAREDYVSCDPLTFNMECTNAAGGPCPQANCHFTGLDSPHSSVYLHLVNLLGFFWTMFFISGVSDMILASTFSSWYWTFHKRDLPFFTLTRGIFRTLWYHLGTVALGALIIAIVRVIRVILEVIDRKLKKYDNPVTRCLMCCCKCFFWCLENFLKFINKNAYIMCAVHGGNFCKSARDAFSLLMRNIVRVAVLDKVTDLIFFLSKLLMSIGVGFAVYYLLQWSVVYEVTSSERLNFNYVPAVILSLATYLICTLFFNVYAMAVDTLFLCFLEDCERNDGSPEKPYFMSKNLMKILGKKNKQF